MKLEIMNYIGELRDVIRKLHGVESKHIRPCPGTSPRLERSVWRGKVEVFRLTGHPKARRAYAWAYQAEEPKPHREYVAVLRVAPVTSPKLAVRAAIVQEHRANAKKE